MLVLHSPDNARVKVKGDKQADMTTTAQLELLLLRNIPVKLDL